MFTLCLVDVSTTRTYSSVALTLRSGLCGHRLLRPIPTKDRRPSSSYSPYSTNTNPNTYISSTARHIGAPVQRGGRVPMDNFFIDALVRASLCRYHSSALPANLIPARPRTQSQNHPPRRPYSNSTNGNNGPPPTTTTPTPNSSPEIIPRPPFSPEVKSALKSFSDPYYDRADDSSAEDPPRVHPNDPKGELRPPLPWSVPTNPEDHAVLRRFTRQLFDPGVTLELLYKTYRTLPSPPILHLGLHQINAFVAKMMTVPQRTEAGMLRYLAVLDDMRSAGIPISRSEYNAAISFVARSFMAVTPQEARAAIQLWKKSELAVVSDTTTFNILLDMASRSDTPVLVEWLLREIEAREIPHDRFTHTTLITYHGLRADGEGVRLAYRRLVDAGEIVDTVVLNAVMSAFLRSGQPQSAEYIYENMKRATLDPPVGSPPATRPPEDWVGKRRWAKHLKAVAERRRRIIGGYMKEFNASLAPDIYTFNMMVTLASKTGEYGRAMELVGEMEPLGVKLDSSIVLALLKGFYWYGGMQHTPWAEAELDRVVEMAFGEEVVMDGPLARWALMATARVGNSRKGVRRVWERVERRLEECGGVVDGETAEVVRGFIGGGGGDRYIGFFFFYVLSLL